MRIKTVIFVVVATIALAGSPANAAAGGDPPPPAIPTPALLPGLLGFGLSILRKQKNEAES